LNSIVIFYYLIFSGIRPVDHQFTPILIT